MADSNWPKCIITVLDVIGTKNEAKSGKASKTMMEMRNFASHILNGNELSSQSHGYIWNDSIMLLAHNVDTVPQRVNLLRQLDAFKAKLESHCHLAMYGMAVMGKTFPEDPLFAPAFDGQIAHQPRAVSIKASSWALANCFIVEKEMKAHRACWYLDSRVTKGCGLRKPDASKTVSLQPAGKLRAVHAYRGALGIA